MSSSGASFRTLPGLISRFGDLEGILAHADEIEAKRARTALLEGAEDARLSKELVTIRRDGRFRYYRLEPTPLKELYDWVEHYRKFWTGKLDRLGQYLEKRS